MSTFFMMALGPAGGSVTPPVAASMASVLISAIVYGEREREREGRGGIKRWDGQRKEGRIEGCYKPWLRGGGREIESTW